MTDAGDWLALGSYLAKGGRGGYYDIVLTAETIYSEESQIRLLECIKQVRGFSLLDPLILLKVPLYELIAMRAVLDPLLLECLTTAWQHFPHLQAFAKTHRTPFTPYEAIPHP